MRCCEDGERSDEEYLPFPQLWNVTFISFIILNGSICVVSKCVRFPYFLFFYVALVVGQVLIKLPDVTLHIISGLVRHVLW